MSATKRRGRPALPRGAKKDAPLIVRLTAEDRYEINAAAERDGMGTSEWARKVLLEAVALSRLVEGLPADGV